MRIGQSRTTLATLLFAAMFIGITDGVASAAPAAELRKLAAAEFSNLTPAETALLMFAGSYRSEPGGFALAGPSAKPDDPSNDPAHAEKWGKEREVRADLIRWLCVDPRATALIDPQGIRLLGARITGKLNLAHVTVPFALALRNCSIGERMTFEHTLFPSLDLGGCYTAEIDGQGMVVHADLDLSFVHAAGEVWFPSSSIDGNLYAIGGQFRRSKVEPQPSARMEGTALDAGSSTIRGTEILCCGLEVDGALILGGASVGSVFFSGATFNNPNNIAILASGIRVDHIVFLGSSPFSHEGVTINGLVAFLSAHVAEGLIVQDAMFLGAAADLHGFDARGMSADTLTWQRVKLENGAFMNLKGVAIRALIDDSQSWPAAGKLALNELTYSQLVGFAGDGRSLLDARSRLRWLALQPEFDAQPYRQLAKVLREQGDEPGATEVLIAAEDRRYASYGYASALWGGFLNATIGYGHKPLRTIGWSLFVILVGWPIVWAAKRAGVMRPTFPENIPPSSESDYEELHPLLYSLDAFLPFVNLHQEHYWWPNSKASGDCVILGRKFRLRGSLVRHYLWLQIFSGWLLSAILIAGVTGLMRSD
jgi:hypothetical protein